MLLIYNKEDAMAARSVEEAEKSMAGHWSFMDEITKRGVYRAGEPLEPTATAATVRRQDGKSLILDGPFAETKEQLGGYYILDCQNLDEAVAWAAKLPLTCGGGESCVEVRPIREIPARPERPQAEYTSTVNG
jgi:hypothetical protein